MLTLANSADNPSQTPLSHLKGRTILTKTDAVYRVEEVFKKRGEKNSFFVGSYKSHARKHCQTMQHTTKVQEEIAGSQSGVQLL